MLWQLLSVVGAVHRAGLVHRDIKPANVLLDATGTGRPHSYLSDSGIAVDLNGPRFTETGIIFGTPGFTAPEAEALADPAPEADLFAVGMVGAAMLTGPRPKEIVLTSAPDGVRDALWSLVTDLASPRQPAGRRSCPQARAADRCPAGSASGRVGARG